MTLESSLKTKRLCVFSDTPGSGYLFSCLITCLHGYKIGHEKRINKVLHPCVDTLNLFKFWHGGHKYKFNYFDMKKYFNENGGIIVAAVATLATILASVFVY